MKYILALFIAFQSSFCFAKSEYQESFIGVIEKRIPDWTQKLTPVALKIFLIIWIFETFSQIVFKNVLNNNMKQLLTYLITRICFAGFFSYALIKPDFYMGIIHYLGSLTTPIHVENNLIKGLDSSWVFSQFKLWEDNVYTPVIDNISSLSVGRNITYALLYDFYMICTCFIALLIVVIQAEIYLVVFGGLILTGFAGSAWTLSYWTRYLDTVFGLAIRVMVFGMLYSILKHSINIDPHTVATVDISDSVVSIILTTCCLWIVPSKVAGMVSGAAAGNSLGQAMGLGLATYALAGNFGSKLASSSLPFSKIGPSGDSQSKKLPKSPDDGGLGGESKVPPAKKMPPNYMRNRDMPSDPSSSSKGEIIDISISSGELPNNSDKISDSTKEAKKLLPPSDESNNKSPDTPKDK